MTMNFNGGYGYNPYYNTNNQLNGFSTQYSQNQPSIIFVSNVAEVNATKPDVTGKPLFFYNKAEEEIYIKQYDNMGLAPLKTYKLVVAENTTTTNPIIDSIKGLNDKLDDIKKLLTPEIIEENDKKNRR